MIKLLDMAKYFLTKGNIPADGILADFTMGNGNDTLYLCGLAPEGKVYAFDIQQKALENTKKRLEENGRENAVLIQDSHHRAEKYIEEKLHGGMFNLGYLPGGDKTLHTMCESTIVAVKSAINMLLPGAVLVISVSPGHEEGKKEGNLILNELEKYDKTEYSVAVYRIINSPDAPFIIAVQKNKLK